MTFGLRLSSASSVFGVLGVLATVLAACAAHEGESQGAAGADLDVRAVLLPAEWPNHGSADCHDHTNSESTIFTFKYDADTFILRENKCLNFEANFIYVLFGHDKVLIQDTGSIPEDMNRTQFSAAFPLRDTVEGLIAQWLAAHPNADGSARGRETMELLVTHSHSHEDHVSGDYQFADASGHVFPNTKVAGLRPNQVAAFFGITAWPNQGATLDLGNRKLDVLPIPGHESAHVAVYDHQTHVLMSGDSLYPGHLFVSDWGTYRTSMQRLDAWVHEVDAAGARVRPISYVLGNHIEKKPTAGDFYPYPTWFQSPERKLELQDSDVTLLAQQTQSLGPTSPGKEIFLDDFAIDASN